MSSVAYMSEVLYEVADHIATITLNAPERMNTISGPMLDDVSARCSMRTAIGTVGAASSLALAGHSAQAATSRRR